MINEESDDDDESDDQSEQDTDGNETSSDNPDDSEIAEKEPKAIDSKDVKINLKPVNSTNPKPKSTNNYNLTSNKFMKQIASAEQNVKKLLHSSPKKQTNPAQAPSHHLPKATKQSASNYNK